MQTSNRPATPRLWRLCALLLALTLLFTTFGVDAQQPPAVPDYTAGAVPAADGPHDWTLGPTGARGFVFVHKNTSRWARQIYISRVAEGSPADGLLAVGDVVLGVGGERFTRDARVAFAHAIQRAESEHAGRLTLLRWRGGETQTITLQLDPLPAFSATAPFDCKKSDRLLEAGARALADKGLVKTDLPTHINALALLATGDADYRPLLEDYAHRVAARDLTEHRGLHAWEYAYATLFLAEYCLATGDEVVLDAVKKQALEIARGQSVMGNWGHRFVRPELGRLGGYGAINSVSVPLATALVLARECGADDPDIHRAIQRSADFFRRYVGLGAIPYGDHPPNRQYGHDDNGKNSNAAVFFDLLGDAEATAYYRRTAVAAVNGDREQGHTGNFFNILWSMPGVVRGGPLATGGYLGAFGWYYDLARDWQHGYPHQGNPGSKKENYHRWDCPGVYLLHFAVARRAIRITGKGPATLPAMTRPQVDEALAAGLHDYAAMSADELTAALSSWSPVVRYESAGELKRRQVPPTQDLAGLARSDDEPQRLAGLAGAAALTEPERLVTKDRLIEAAAVLVRHGSTPVQHEAVRALAAIDRRRAAAELVPYLAAYRPGDDPMLSQAIVFELFNRRTHRGVLPLSVIEDRALAVDAARQMLRHEDPRVIGYVVGTLGGLDPAEQARLMPDLLAAGSKDTPSNIMFMMGARLSCLEMASAHRIEEAIAPLVEIAAFEGWGRGNAAPRALKLLTPYGSAAAEHLPALRQARETAARDEKLVKAFDQAITAIQSDQDAPDTVTLQQFVWESQVGNN